MTFLLYCSAIIFFGKVHSCLKLTHSKKNFFHPFLPAWRHFTTQNHRFFWSAKRADFLLSSGHQVDHFKGMRLRLGLGQHNGDESFMILLSWWFGARWFGARWFGIPRVPFTNNPFLNQVGDFTRLQICPRKTFSEAFRHRWYQGGNQGLAA